MRYFLGFCSVLLLLILIFACSRTPYTYTHSNAYFEQLKLEKLEQLQNSILKITCSNYYQNYFYRYPTSSVDSVLQSARFYAKNLTTNSVAGTGLILYQDTNKQLLLTCYHIFDFEDTVKTYFIDENREPTQFLASLSIKLGQDILTFHKNGRSTPANVIAIDKQNDLALIETSPGEILLYEIPFKGTFGNADKIKFGQEIHLLGFPKGFFMITRGLLSKSPFKNKFIVDAPFNRGFSGGIVFIFTEQEPFYEYLGIANSIAYNSEPVLVPPEDPKILEQYQNLPYDGEYYVKDLKLLNYGITFVVKSNVVVDFIKSEMKRLRQLGYNFSITLD